ncbi:hypothetical protein [Azospirillum sp. ST 5-10]|uniref:hypothetical protein n=1 Tax=unclassified Azospirillum TaxID=2630922 RepID=UPI003F4A1555
MSAATERLAQYNGGLYKADTNPYGFDGADGGVTGFEVNLPRALNDMGAAAGEVVEAAGAVATLAAQVDIDATTATTQAGVATAKAGEAADSADAAAQSAADVQGLVDSIAGGPVATVNGQAGPNVVLDAAAVGALPSTATAADIGAANTSLSNVPASVIAAKAENDAFFFASM